MFEKNVNSAATTNGQRVMTPQRGGEIWSITCSNSGAAAAFVKIYDVVDVVVGTTVPILVIGVPPGGNTHMQFLKGLQFRVGLSLAITNLGPDADTTAVLAGQVKACIVYGG